MNFKQLAKNVRKELKTEFPNCKFSVRVGRYSGGQQLYISLMSAPFLVIAPGWHSDDAWLHLTDCADVGDCVGFYRLTEKGDEMLGRVCEIVNQYNWQVDSQMARDFNIRNEVNIEVGQFEKSFEVIQ